MIVATRAKRASLVLLGCLVALPVAAGHRIERELELAPGGRLVVDTVSGSVEVRGSSRSGARLVLTSRRDDLEERFDVDIRSSAGLVEIRVTRKGARGLLSWVRGAQLEFELEVPRRTELDLDTSGGSIFVESIAGDTRLDTSGGSIRATDVDGDVHADTSGGSIEVVDVRGDVRADTSGGSIQVEQVRGHVIADTSGGSIVVRDTGGDIEADTSGGSIRIRGAGGRVRASTSGGSIQASFAPGNGRGGDLSTSGGRIDVALDPTVDLEIDASSSGGNVTSDLPIEVHGRVSRSSMRGTLGSGGAVLRLRNSGGPIRIERN